MGVWSRAERAACGISDSFCSAGSRQEELYQFCWVLGLDSTVMGLPDTKQSPTKGSCKSSKRGAHLAATNAPMIMANTVIWMPQENFFLERKG